jgi:hypothetical protein
MFSFDGAPLADPRCKICRESLDPEVRSDGFCSKLCKSTWDLREARKAKKTATMDDTTRYRSNSSYADELAGELTLSIQQFSFSTLLRMRSPAGFVKAPICQMKERDLIAAGLWDLLPK